MRIAVAGATGVVGRHVVDVAKERGHEVVSLSRATGQDLVTGTGLNEALAAVDAVIDVSNVTTMSARKAVAFFQTATRNLLAAERRNGVEHHVALSIVGIDDIDLAGAVTPGLTTVRMPIERCGTLAVDLLLQAISGIAISPLATLDSQLIVRASTAAPAVSAS